VDNTYKKIEIVGTSTTSVTNAIENAITKAGETVKNLGWFEVKEIRGRIDDGTKVGQYQVTMLLGFRLE
jgi:flavin-binding protein dodecin